MTSAFDTAFQRRLRERLEAELAEHEAKLLNGTLRNFEDYKRLTGIREGLKRGLDLMVEVERGLTSPEPKGKTAA